MALAYADIGKSENLRLYFSTASALTVGFKEEHYSISCKWDKPLSNNFQIPYAQSASDIHYYYAKNGI
jgi:hypothetical protein